MIYQLYIIYGLKLNVEVKDMMICDVLEDSLTALAMEPQEKSFKSHCLIQ
jgi:hypothetical protein